MHETATVGRCSVRKHRDQGRKNGRAGEGEPAGLLHAADAAMYQAKSLGNGRHVVFDKRTCPLARPENDPQ
ncbi:MAG: hypothetical protein PHG96_12775 [Kiritimatiellae bacterium]|nr:hypothetical protein [Kiritimatiellia bacterium]